MTKPRIRNLLVPVAASATHVAYSSLRVEPQYMIMGHAAGIAAVMAAQLDVPVQRIQVADLQRRLQAQGAVLDDPGDLADSGFYTEIEWAYYQGITSGCGERLFCPDDRLRREFLRPFTRGHAHRLVAPLVEQEVGRQAPEAMVGAFRAQQTGDAVLHHLGQTAGVVTEHGHATGHRFECGQAETFRPRWQQE